MPRKKKIEVTEAALAELGAPRLAAILFEISGREKAVENRLRLALTAASGADNLASALAKRIGEIKRGSRFVDWREAATFAEDLNQVRAAIADDLLPQAPRSAADLLQDFLATFPRIVERVDDSGGYLSGVYAEAVENWVSAWARVPDLKPTAFADAVMREYDQDEYGIKGRLIAQAADTMGQQGLLYLREKYLHRVRTRKPEPNQHGFDYGLTGIIAAIEQIGDALGDVDMILEAVRFASRPTAYAVEVAERLLRKGRAAEARDWAERGLAAKERDQSQLIDLWISSLDALGDNSAAQRERWNWFSQTLSLAHFTAYLTNLPTTDRLPTTDDAIRIAFGHNSVETALTFLVDTCHFKDAERLVLERFSEFNGRAYYSIRPAADRLADERPLGAMLLYRLLCRAVLVDGKSKSYSYAARDLIRAGELSTRVMEFAGHGDHDDYLQALRQQHGRKYGFWGLVK